MDFTEKKRVQSPEIRANPISKFFWIWLFDLLIKGSKKDLTIDDLYDRLPEDDASRLGDKMQRIWENECLSANKEKKRPSLRKTGMRFFGPKFFYFTLYVCIMEIIFKLSQPFILRSMIQSFSKQLTSESEAEKEEIRTQQYLYTGALIFVTLVYALNLHHIYGGLMHLAMKIRLGLQALIFRKLLKISKTVQSEKASIGKLANLIGSDTNRFEHCFFHINMLVAGPIQLVILTYFLYMELGVSCFVGIGIIAGVLIPFQVIVGRLSAKYRAQVAQRTDERGRMLSEIIVGIRIIKMYAWEKPLSAVIRKLRIREILPVRKAAYLKGTFQSINFLGKTTIPFCTFIIYVSLGNVLTADKAYFSISAYTIMIMAMAQKIPVAAAQTAELMVAIHRIEDFLLLEELQTQGKEKLKLSKGCGLNTIIASNDYNKDQVPRIWLDNVNARWTSDKLTLNNISLDVSGSQLVTIVGPVGGSKSSLLNLLISELPLSTGSMSIRGKFSYCSQDPFIFSSTIRQNILFGSLYDKLRYDKCIKVCGLEHDLQEFPNGDLTIVGERGVSLSGGQKSRINLCRAIYKPSNIYLLDDPLSAVDTRVGRTIFEKCIKEYLKEKLIILVTHQIQYLPQSDYIIVFNEQGQVQGQGKYQDLISQNLEFLKSDDNETSLLSKDSDSSSSSDDEDEDDVTNISLPLSKTKDAHHKIESQVERQETGSVTWKTYFNYITAGNSKLELVIVIFLFISSQALVSFTDKWLSFWTNEVSRRSSPDASSKDAQYSDDTYITVYSICVTGVLFLVSAKAILFFHYCMSISVNLHEKMFGSLVHAPVKFFDKNSSGRIINRFTKDLNYVDEQLPSALGDCIGIFLLVTGIMAVVISTNYYLALPCLLLIFVLLQIRKFYVKTARDIKRIDSITKSPIFLHLSSSVQGLTTIRGLEAEEKIIDQFDSLLDINTSSAYLVVMGNRWMGSWMDLMCTLFLACVAFSFIVFSSTAEGGNVGMAISLTLNLLTMAQWGMRQSADVENYMTSIERVFEYCKIKPETNLVTKSESPKNWPSNGAIKFSHVSLSYDEKNQVQVLKNLNFEILGKEKIGIVGRTGAGKSSIINCLFRLTNAQGEIYIDDIPISNLPLDVLRTSISIIPQDPVLFSGTLRYNLDPFGQFSDKELWEVLKEVNLSEAVTSLDHKVSEGGGNYSVGQRQLVCLARAILRNNKVIVMDESTANCDPITDSIIQKEIRKKFKDCTILTIAHRLATIIDNDRILVMENGVIAEFDTPENLLKNPDGLFSLMVKQAGAAAEINLRKIANG